MHEPSGTQLLIHQAWPLGEAMKINVWKEDSCCSKAPKKPNIRSFTFLTIHLFKL